MIGMVVASELVVGDDHLRLITLHQDRQASCTLLDRYVPENLGTILVVPLQHAGVVITEFL
jgi:hypothetical protein